LLVIVEGLDEAMVGIADLFDGFGSATDKLGESWDNLDPAILEAIRNGISNLISPFSAAKKQAEGLQRAFEITTDWSAKLVGGIERLLSGILKDAKGWFEEVAEAAEKVADAIERVVKQLAALVSAAVPDWLKGESPPPMADWLAYVAGAADLATAAIAGLDKGMGQLGMGSMGRLGFNAGAPAYAGSGAGTSIGGDTYNVTINDQMAGAMFMHQSQARSAERLNRGMGR